MRAGILSLLLLVPLLPWAQGTDAPSRGAMLYANHCIECHSQQMHWRNRHVARDCQSLRKQVRIWQANANLQWSQDDIDAVAKHLNDTIYHFPVTTSATR